jgi:glutathione peroxidase
VVAVLGATRPGDVVTYAEVAVEAGYSPRAGRAVGSFLARHGDGHPWWRVVTATGRLVPGHEREHARRLRAEGFEVVGGRVAPMAGHRRAVAASTRHTGRDLADPEETTVSIYDHPVKALDGAPADLHDHADEAVLIVNVASKCGLTPQYEGLERLHERFQGQGFTVLGFPCNQFLEQEPGTPDEIATFCSTTYGVTFPLYEKVDVNGERRHPLYAALTETTDGEGHAGDIRWNFEKFLVAPGGDVVARFAPQTEPEAPEVVAAIEGALPKGTETVS